MDNDELGEFLEEKYRLYNRQDFIDSDPIQIPHRFSKKEDIEISAFLASTIAWGQRKTIINNANKLMDWMDESPHDFILNFEEQDLIPFEKFVHRTFNGGDCITFLNALQHIYKNKGGLETVLAKSFQSDSKVQGQGWHLFKEIFFDIPHLSRTRKHLPDPLKGSAAKRMNMFLRWMVRKDKQSVDFGIWNAISPSDLYLPLDVHTSRVGRKLGLIQRKQDDWKTVVELTNRLKEFDTEDPVKFDFALFGLGVFEKF